MGAEGEERGGRKEGDCGAKRVGVRFFSDGGLTGRGGVGYKNHVCGTRARNERRARDDAEGGSDERLEKKSETPLDEADRDLIKN